MRTQSTGEETTAVVTEVRLEGGCRGVATAGAPLVSVVAVVFQHRKELEAILDSVAPFRGDDLEFIVIDGASDDGTADLLRQREDSVDYWLSEPDGGLYEGMNRGVAASRGRFLLHINAGDRLLRVPWELLRSLGENVDALCCRVEEGGRDVWAPRSNSLMRFQNTWHHQGTFYRRSSHLGYDTSYRIFADYDLNQRMLLAGQRVRFSSDIVAFHEMGGMSSGNEAYREKLRLIRTNYGSLTFHLTRCLYFAQHHYWSFRRKLQGSRV